MKNNKGTQIKETIKNHIINNGKEYIIVTIIFVIGIFLGVLFINNVNEAQKVEISTYLNNFIEKLKNTEILDNMELLKTSIGQNLILGIMIWFFGTTVIGIPVVFGIILYRGFCMGYTIAVSISILGLSKGLIFVIISLLLQSIFFIPAILALAVSGFKLYKSIVKDKRRENIKVEILRHTIFSLVMIMSLVIASVVEIFVSTNLLKIIIKYL